VCGWYAGRRVPSSRHVSTSVLMPRSTPASVMNTPLAPFVLRHVHSHAFTPCEALYPILLHSQAVRLIPFVLPMYPASLLHATCYCLQLSCITQLLRSGFCPRPRRSSTLFCAFVRSAISSLGSFDSWDQWSTAFHSVILVDVHFLISSFVDVQSWLV